MPTLLIGTVVVVVVLLPHGPSISCKHNVHNERTNIRPLNVDYLQVLTVDVHVID